MIHHDKITSNMQVGEEPLDRGGIDKVRVLLPDACVGAEVDRGVCLRCAASRDPSG